MTNNELVCASDKASKIVGCVEEALGDGIKQDIVSQGLKTQNSLPSRIWDILNTLLCDSMSVFSCIASVTKRGAWEFVPVFDVDTGILWTFMRESRFVEIKRKHLKGKNKSYYVTCLVESLNKDLISNQIALFQVDPPDNDFMRKTVQKIINDLQIEEGKVKRHALVLFEGKNFELLSIRAVMINRYMDIVYNENWNKYITRSESTVMDSASDYSPATNNPSRGLELTPKAAARKNKKMNIKKMKQDDETIS